MTTQTENFDGHELRDCGDHRSVGQRAWCYDCSEWCYPGIPCARCEIPSLKADLEQALGLLEGATHGGGCNDCRRRICNKCLIRTIAHGAQCGECAVVSRAALVCSVCDTTHWPHCEAPLTPTGRTLEDAVKQRFPDDSAKTVAGDAHFHSHPDYERIMEAGFGELTDRLDSLEARIDAVRHWVEEDRYRVERIEKVLRGLLDFLQHDADSLAVENRGKFIALNDLANLAHPSNKEKP